MSNYYTKLGFEALETLQEGGLLELYKASNRFIKRKFQCMKYDNPPNFREVHSVPVSEINYTIRSKKLSNYFDGNVPSYAIWDGEWHKLKSHFSSTIIHRSFKQRFCEGKKWENTPYYDRIINDKSKSKTPIKYLGRYDSIYNDIKQNGWDDEEYITVLIDPSGNYIRKHGSHRLSIMKIIDDYETVPVKYMAVHKKWQEIRDNIYNNGFPKEQEWLRNHSDLQDMAVK